MVCCIYWKTLNVSFGFHKSQKGLNLSAKKLITMFAVYDFYDVLNQFTNNFHQDSTQKFLWLLCEKILAHL